MSSVIRTIQRQTARAKMEKAGLTQIRPIHCSQGIGEALSK